MYNIIQRRKIWLTLSAVAVALSILALIIWQLNFGIDFTGGSMLEIKFLGERPSVAEVENKLTDLELSSLTVQPVGEEGMILRFQEISEDKHQQVLNKLGKINNNTQEGIEGKEGEEGIEREPASAPPEKGTNNTEDNVTDNDALRQAPLNETLGEQGSTAKAVEELRFESVGPSIGQELKRKSLYAILAVLIAIVLYIAWAFRKVSKPVASWKYGLTAVITLFHDVMIVLGIFAILGRFLDMEINTAFVAAILTVLGYSVNDTIVVFDRIRENLPRSDEDFEGTVNISVNQTLRRSINTSLTTLLVLLSIFFFGGSTIRDFVLALSMGVFIGTYSSIFLASPVLVVWEKLKS